MTKSRGLREHHGKRGTKVYNIWRAMKERCTNPNSQAFTDYGGRGITISESWAKFSSFYRDMGDPPEGHSIERVDNNQGYSVENCVWATRTAQGRNKRNNVLLTIDGECMPISAWAERYKIPYATIHQRLTKYGWPAEAAVKTPVIRNRAGVKRGQTFWGAEHGVTFHDDRQQVAA